MLEKLLVSHSIRTRPAKVDQKIQASLTTCDRDQLKGWVEDLSFPRHYVAEATANRDARDWLVAEFQKMGLKTELQGEFDNVIATLPGVSEKPALLVGAHYDSVPGTPGADDNASAVSAMLGCAKALANNYPDRNICFVGFNREEDDLLGSFEFVRAVVKGKLPSIQEAHILEMVGFSSSEEGSQQVPGGLPLKLPSTGDFLGVVANGRSRALAKQARVSAATYADADFPLLTFTIPFGLERLAIFSDMLRSDHTPFWKEKIPAIMWTDTANFRNEHYHSASDTPDTLNYEFLEKVYQVLVASMVERSS